MMRYQEAAEPGDRAETIERHRHDCASSEGWTAIRSRVIEARAYGGPSFARSTIMAVAFNGLSTITGFGSLLVAHHRGLWSLGLLLTCGSVTILFAALVWLSVLI